MNIPYHIGFIMDGNGRWAKRIGMPRTYGHRRGVAAMRRVVNACIKEGVKAVSVFAFSSENWKRPESECSYLFDMIREFMERDFATAFVKPVRVTVMGDITRLPQDVSEAIAAKVDETKDVEGFVLNIGINYGGREEILNACNRAILAGAPVDEQIFSSLIYTADLPDPDVIVRTSGEMRLSNFMLWQCAYSELIFLDKLWPDMKASDVKEIIRIYSKRNRRFGALNG